MARALVPDLLSPHPLGAHLPALYQAKDPFALGLAAALDNVMAPVFASLDNLDAYLDPRMAPPDFLDWLGTWVGVALDDSWTLERRREFVARATSLHRVRGTVRGLRAYLEVVIGSDVEVEESGGTAWSTAVGEPFPGRPDFEVEVTLRAGGSRALDLDQLDALVAAAKPANVRHRVSVQGTAPEGPGPDEEHGS
ncbi:MAG TPA: phage tail protein [Candidatus Dormibacteraeota bacterium]|jgi:phage tail-like protein|nr:phage tail protein [Candidatus Dormibacteraeota bacterium]